MRHSARNAGVAKLRKSINRWALCVAGLAFAAASGQPAFPATYDYGNDKASIMDLRVKDPDSLTEEERAILQAANRTGFVHIPACRMGSNAFLVRIDGRDAILTSGHMVVDENTSQIKNGCGPRDLETAVYHPNLSYLDLRDGRPRPTPDDPIMRAVRVEPGVLNLDALVGDFERRKDWVGFFLSEQISQQPSLDGTLRGYLKFTADGRGEGEGYLIGFDPAFDQANGGRSASWQKCETYVTSFVLHTCDTGPGTSSSLLASLQFNEIRFVGMNVSGEVGSGGHVPESRLAWNIGVSGDTIADQLPEGMAFGHE